MKGKKLLFILFELSLLYQNLLLLFTDSSHFSSLHSLTHFSLLCSLAPSWLAQSLLMHCCCLFPLSLSLSLSLPCFFVLLIAIEAQGIKEARMRSSSFQSKCTNSFISQRHLTRHAIMFTIQMLLPLSCFALFFYYYYILLYFAAL